MADDPYKDKMNTVKPEPGVGEDGDPRLGSIPPPPARHVKPEPDDKDDGEPKQAAPETNYIEQLVSKTSAVELEAGVKIGLQLLDSLKTPLDAALVVEDPQAANWLRSIQQLQDSARPARTVVGVVYVPPTCGPTSLSFYHKILT